MTIDVDHEWIELQRLPIGQLRQHYADLFGEPVHSGNRIWLTKRILWRRQALAEGDLSERARQRAAELARDADLRLSPPRPQGEVRRNLPVPSASPPAPASAGSLPGHDDRLPPPGSLLTRAYKGRLHEVKVLAHGFEHQGQFFLSLSAIANKITGTHCNGFWFFKLGRCAKGGQP